MASDREIHEAVARCVAIAVFYHNCEKTPLADAVLAEDVREVAEWLAGTSLGDREAARMIFQPLATELVARYGEEVGARLRADFVAAYRAATKPASPRPRVQGAREASLAPMSVGA